MHKEAKIFINSSGLGQNQDYKWKAERSEDALHTNVLQGKLEKFGGEHAPMALISREPKGDLLLMLGPLPTSRVDPGLRRTQNTVGLLVPAQEEAQIRGIAAQYLRAPEEFAGKLDKLVADDLTNQEYGWSADFTQVRTILDECEPGRSLGESGSAAKFGRYTAPASGATLHNELAEGLMRSPLPSAAQSAIPVLVSQDVPASAFARNHVWRGLSDAFEHEGWQSEEALGAFSSTVGKKEMGHGGKIAIIAGSVALAGLAGGWAWKVTHRKATNNEHRAQTGP